MFKMVRITFRSAGIPSLLQALCHPHTVEPQPHPVNGGEGVIYVCEREADQVLNLGALLCSLESWISLTY